MLVCRIGHSSGHRYAVLSGESRAVAGKAGLLLQCYRWRTIRHYRAAKFRRCADAAAVVKPRRDKRNRLISHKRTQTQANNVPRQLPATLLTFGPFASNSQAEDRDAPHIPVLYLNQ